MFNFLKRDKDKDKKQVRLSAISNILTGSGDGLINLQHDFPLQITAVYQCVRVLSESIGMLPIKLYKRVGDKNVKDYRHPLYRVLAIKPNCFQTASEFWEYMVKSLSLNGNAYSLIVRNGLDQVVELLPIAPNSVSISRNDDYSLTYTVVTLNNESFSVKERDILHIKLFNDETCIKGISPITMARTLLDTEGATQQHAKNLFSNGVVSNGVIEIPTLLDEESFDLFRNSLLESYTGFRNSNKPLLLEGGAKWNSISMSNADSQFLESRRFNKEEIAGIFRVPPHLIGDLTHATFSNIEHQAMEFVQYSLMPYIVKIEQRIISDLLNEEEQTKYYAKFNADALLRGDLNSRYGAYAIGRNNGWLSVNDVRAKEDMSPIVGGDIYLVPLDHGYLDENGKVVNPNQESVQQNGEDNERQEP